MLASSGNWSKPNERGGVVVDPIPWIERVVRVEERLAATIARLDKLEAAAIDNPKILECLAEFTELLEESLNAGEASAAAVPASKSPANSWFSPDIARRSVYAGFAIFLFVISEFLKPDTPAARVLKDFIGG